MKERTKNIKFKFCSKYLFVILPLVLAIFLAGCGGLLTPATDEVQIKAELLQVEVVAELNDIIVVQQGQTVNFTINLSASGKLDASYTPTNSATAQIPTIYSVGAGGITSATEPSSVYGFWHNPDGPQAVYRDARWTGYPTPYSVSAQASAASDAPLGDYPITIVPVLSPDPTGPAPAPKLTNDVADTLTIRVVAATKATPVITWSNPADIIYGTALSSTQLNATADVAAGTFVYTPLAGTVLNAGSGQTLSVDFTPTDTANYNSASKDVTINVIKATPIISWEIPADIVYGTALSGTQLNASTDVDGSFAYDPTDGTKLNAGALQALKTTFTPDDAANYNTVSVSVLINVLKATPIISWEIPADIVYGTALSGTQLNASTDVDGSFAYDPTDGTVLNAGSGQNLHVDFIPTDMDNYNNASKDVKINVIYNSSGILQPINADGSSVFKQGSTVPAKFRVADINGNSIGTPGVVTDFKLFKIIVGTEVLEPNEPALSTTPDTAFRWSASDEQWIFNISTKNLAKNKTYVYRITLNDGTAIIFQFGLK